MYCVFLHGPPACGKHTIGTLLSALLGVPLFHNHLTVDLAAALHEFGTPGFVALRERVWLAAFETAAATGRSFIFTFAPERSVDPQLIGCLQRAIDRRGGRTVYIELHCGDAEVLSRLGNDSRAAFGKLRDADLYRRIRDAGGFEFPALPTPLLVVDTGVVAPAVAAARIRAALELDGLSGDS
jgi:hypothetical protein